MAGTRGPPPPRRRRGVPADRRPPLAAPLLALAALLALAPSAAAHLFLDGVSALTVAALPAFPSDPPALTIEFYMRPDADAVGGRAYVLDARPGVDWVVLFDDGLFGFGCSTELTVSVAASSIAADQWIHVAFVGDATQRLLYLDGVLVSTALSTTCPIDVGTGVVVGARYVSTIPTGPGYFSGYIDDLRLWGAVRTSDEISGAFGSESLPYPELIAYFKFDVDPAFAFADSSNSGAATLSVRSGSPSVTLNPPSPVEPLAIVVSVEYLLDNQLRPVIDEGRAFKAAADGVARLAGDLAADASPQYAAKRVELRAELAVEADRLVAVSPSDAVTVTELVPGLARLAAVPDETPDELRKALLGHAMTLVAECEARTVNDTAAEELARLLVDPLGGSLDLEALVNIGRGLLSGFGDAQRRVAFAVDGRAALHAETTAETTIDTELLATRVALGEVSRRVLVAIVDDAEVPAVDVDRHTGPATVSFRAVQSRCPIECDPASAGAPTVDGDGRATCAFPGGRANGTVLSLAGPQGCRFGVGPGARLARIVDRARPGLIVFLTFHALFCCSAVVQLLRALLAHLERRRLTMQFYVLISFSTGVLLRLIYLSLAVHSATALPDLPAPALALLQSFPFALLATAYALMVCAWLEIVVSPKRVKGKVLSRMRVPFFAGVGAAALSQVGILAASALDDPDQQQSLSITAGALSLSLVVALAIGMVYSALKLLGQARAFQEAGSKKRGRLEQTLALASLFGVLFLVHGSCWILLLPGMDDAQWAGLPLLMLFLSTELVCDAILVVMTRKVASHLGRDGSAFTANTTNASMLDFEFGWRIRDAWNALLTSVSSMARSVMSRGEQQPPPPTTSRPASATSPTDDGQGLVNRIASQFNDPEKLYGRRDTGEAAPSIPSRDSKPSAPSVPSRNSKPLSPQPSPPVSPRSSHRSSAPRPPPPLTTLPEDHELENLAVAVMNSPRSPGPSPRSTALLQRHSDAEPYGDRLKPPVDEMRRNSFQ